MQNSEIKYPSQFVELPSKGLLYSLDNPCSDGRVEMRYPTAQDENILTSRALIQKGTHLDIFIQNLILTPNVKIQDLILGDFNALLVSSRILAYGSEYGAKVACERCGIQQEVMFNLDHILSNNVEINKEFKRGVNQFQIVLPISGKKLTYKLLTRGQDKQIDNILKKQKKIGGIDTQLTTRLKYSIVSIDGVTDPFKIIQFLSTMPSRDSLAFRNEIRSTMPDINTSVHHQCIQCGHSQDIKIPIGPDFFYPTR